MFPMTETKTEMELQIVNVTISTQRVTVRKKRDVVSAAQNSRNRIVDPVHSVILDIQIAEHVNVI